MSTATKPIWRTAKGRSEADFDGVWLYENAYEWTIYADERGIITIEYLSTQVMPMPKKAVPDLEEEWRAELVSMTPAEFAKFMLWVGSE